MDAMTMTSEPQPLPHTDTSLARHSTYIVRGTRTDMTLLGRADRVMLGTRKWQRVRAIPQSQRVPLNADAQATSPSAAAPPRTLCHGVNHTRTHVSKHNRTVKRSRAGGGAGGSRRHRRTRHATQPFQFSCLDASLNSDVQPPQWTGVWAGGQRCHTRSVLLLAECNIGVATEARVVARYAAAWR